MSEEQAAALDLTTGIVAAFVANNTIAAADLPGLIRQVHGALVAVSSGASTEPVVPQAPAVSIKKSITPDHLICLEDGRKFKSLKRHLRSKFDLTPEQYRAKWGLPRDYPMVAPSYAEARSQLAKSMGLGQGGRVAKAKVTAKAGRGRAKAG